MPLQFDLAYFVHAFQMTVHHAANAPDRKTQEQSIKQALDLAVVVLDEAIDELLKDGVYENQTRRFSHATMQDGIEPVTERVLHLVLHTEDGLARFLADEKVLLRIAGWEEQNIDEFTDYITQNLHNLVKSVNFHHLIHDLHVLRKELDDRRQQPAHALVFLQPVWQRRLVLVSGGVSLIVLDVKAVSLIGDVYQVISVGIGSNLISDTIKDLSNGG